METAARLRLCVALTPLAFVASCSAHSGPSANRPAPAPPSEAAKPAAVRESLGGQDVPAHPREAAMQDAKPRASPHPAADRRAAVRPERKPEPPILGPRQVVRAGHRDESGRFVQTGVFVEPAPHLFRSRGIDHVSTYVALLTKPDATHASLIVATLDGNKACLLARSGADVRVLESIVLAPPDQADPERGRKVRALFGSLGVRPVADTIHDYNGVANSMEDLEYPIGHDAAYVTKVTTRLLREVLSIGPEEGLSFTFEAAPSPAAGGATEFHSETR